MAKQRGPVASTFTGRVGNVVGAKMKGGEYVTRSYQPSVKNPNTLRQRVSRLRMATASRLAAALALAVQTGYAKASGSTRMYPRNMFVRDLVSMGGMGAMAITDMEPVITYNKLQLSKAFGISAAPIVSGLSFEEPGTLAFVVTPGAVSDILPAGKLGIVTVVYDPVLGQSVVDMHDAPVDSAEEISIAVPTNFASETVHVYAFYKWIPETGNDIVTLAEPWKYPSETSATVYVGTGTIG